MSKDITGKVALVTGGARGIGRAIAERLAADGADVAVLDLRQESCAETVAAIEALGRRAIAIGADVTDRDAVFAAVERTATELGGFDIMINNAGIAQVQPMKDITPEEARLICDINIMGVLWGIQAAAAKLEELGHGGAIISASSAAGHEGSPMLSIYSATKFAVRALTQAAAQEYAGLGVTVNCYCPGVVDTDMWVEIDRRFHEVTGAELGATYQGIMSRITLGRAQKPEDVANLVSFLAGPEGDYITGQSIITDGGIVFR